MEPLDESKELQPCSKKESKGPNLGALGRVQRAPTPLKKESKGSNLGALGRVQRAPTLLKKREQGLQPWSPWTSPMSSNPAQKPQPVPCRGLGHRPATRRARIVESSLMSARKDETALGFRTSNAPRAHRPATAGGGSSAASVKGARLPVEPQVDAGGCLLRWPLAPSAERGSVSPRRSERGLSGRHLRAVAGTVPGTPAPGVSARQWHAAGQPCRRKGVSSRAGVPPRRAGAVPHSSCATEHAGLRPRRVLAASARARVRAAGRPDACRLCVMKETELEKP